MLMDQSWVAGEQPLHHAPDCAGNYRPRRFISGPGVQEVARECRELLESGAKMLRTNRGVANIPESSTNKDLVKSLLSTWFMPTGITRG